MISREGSAALYLPSRFKLEQEMTDAKAERVKSCPPPAGVRFEEYRIQSPTWAPLFCFRGFLEASICFLLPGPIVLEGSR